MSELATDVSTGAAVRRPVPGAAVRESAQGTWFRPADGTGGSLLRLPVATEASTVRRLRRLALPGLLPVDLVWEDDGRLWVATSLPPGPTVADLLADGRRLGLGTGDAAAVLGAVARTLRALHTRGLGHGTLDASAVLITPRGAPVLVVPTGGAGYRDRDLAAWAGLAWELAAAWCGTDPTMAGALRGCADLAEAAGLAAALGALPVASDGEGRRAAVRTWSAAAAGGAVPVR
jgi:hypothetical protein